MPDNTTTTTNGNGTPNPNPNPPAKDDGIVSVTVDGKTYVPAEFVLTAEQEQLHDRRHKRQMDVVETFAGLAHKAAPVLGDAFGALGAGIAILDQRERDERTHERETSLQHDSTITASEHAHEIALVAANPDYARLRLNTTAILENRGLRKEQHELALVQANPDYAIRKMTFIEERIDRIVKAASELGQALSGIGSTLARCKAIAASTEQIKTTGEAKINEIKADTKRIEAMTALEREMNQGVVLGRTAPAAKKTTSS